MPNVLTQPYRRPPVAAEDNYLRTLDQPFDLAAAVRKHGQGQVALAAFLRAHPSGAATVWALANNSVGPRVWRATQPGDLVLFYGNREVYAYGFVSSKVYWPQNDAIWPSGTDWDYVYSLRDFHAVPAGTRPSTNALRPLLGKSSAQSAQLHDMSTRGTTAVSVFHERGALAHQQVVFQLQQLIAGRGHTPLYGEPQLNFDISWTDAHATYVVEVKSLTLQNQADQITLGLGQVLDYRWTYSAAQPDVTIKAVLVTETEPIDARWVDVCAAVGVLLTWPERMAADLDL